MTCLTSAPNSSWKLRLSALSALPFPLVPRLLFSLLLFTLPIFFTRPIFADENSAENKAAARDLAIEGIKLAQAGNCDLAIDPLSRAEALYHAPTILTWIGQCQIELGRLVEGTETLNRVVREKTAPNAPAAYIRAKERAADLIETAKPKIGKLTIYVEPNDAPDLVIQVNGRAISNALIGAPRPSDPGLQSISVSATGFEASDLDIELEPGDKKSVTLSLNPLPETASPIRQDEEIVKPQDPAARKSMRWVGWSLVGLGGGLTAAGGVTGYLAIHKKGQLDCPDRSACPPSQKKTLSAAQLNAALATAFIGVGAAALTTGIVFLVLDIPKVPQARVGNITIEPRVGFASAGLVGAF